MAYRGGRLALALLSAVTALAIAAGPATAATAVVYRYGDTTQRIVALTFDDGYSASRSLKIAAILDRYGITATFLPYANAVSGAPSAWHSIAKRYPIGNHTISHRNLKKLSTSEVFREIDGGRRIIERVTNRRMIRIFRPPYGNYNTTVLQQSYNAGFKKVAMWSVDSGDALGYGEDTIYKRAIAGGRGAIVLLHAGPAATVRALPRIIENYRARGFRFVNLAEMLGVTWNRNLISATEPVGGTTPIGVTPTEQPGTSPVEPAPSYQTPYRRPTFFLAI